MWIVMLEQGFEFAVRGPEDLLLSLYSGLWTERKNAESLRLARGTTRSMHPTDLAQQGGLPTGIKTQASLLSHNVKDDACLRQTFYPRFFWIN